MNMNFKTAFSAALLAIFALPYPALAINLEQSLIAPLAPQGNNRLAIHAENLDPAKPVWVAFTVVALSKDKAPVGKISVDAFPENIPIRGMGSMVVFSAEDGTPLPQSGEFGRMLTEKIGTRSPEELRQAFGPALAEAAEARAANQGSAIGHTIVRRYDLGGKTEVDFKTSVENADGIQPLLLTVTLGQGDIPEAVSSRFTGGLTTRSSHTRLIVSSISFLASAALLIGWITRARNKR